MRQKFSGHEGHVPRDNDDIVAECQRRFDASKSAEPRAFIAHYWNIIKPVRRLISVGGQCNAASGREKSFRYTIDQPSGAKALESLGASPETSAQPTGQPDAQRAGGTQILNPRRSAAASSSTVSARSTRGTWMSVPRRSLR